MAATNLKLYMKKMFSSVGLAAYTVALNNSTLVEENNTLIDVARHLATVEVNYSAVVYEGFPEVVIMRSVGKR